MPYRFVIECSLENRLVDNAFVDDLVVLVKGRLGRYMSPEFNLDELAFQFDYGSKLAGDDEEIKLGDFLEVEALNKYYHHTVRKYSQRRHDTLLSISSAGLSEEDSQKQAADIIEQTEFEMPKITINCKVMNRAREPTLELPNLE